MAKKREVPFYLDPRTPDRRRAYLKAAEAAGLRWPDWARLHLDHAALGPRRRQQGEEEQPQQTEEVADVG